MFEELGIGDVIDHATQHNPEPRFVTAGNAVKAMVLNGLGFVNQQADRNSKSCAGASGAHSQEPSSGTRQLDARSAPDQRLGRRCHRGGGAGPAGRGKGEDETVKIWGRERDQSCRSRVIE